MTKLSPEEIAKYAKDAGFEGRDLTVAVAVALAESGGQAKAHNDTPPDDSYGLWQINMYQGLGPDRRQQFDLDANRELFDPKTNAEAAFAISGKGQSFEPWTTYTSGKYKDFLDDARKGIKALTEPRNDNRPAKAGRLRVDPDALAGYVTTTRNISDELAALKRHELKGHGFGKIGEETGFSDALERFGGALRHQVKALRANADKLAGAVAKTARHYREQDADIAQDLLGLLRGK